MLASHSVLVSVLLATACSAQANIIGAGCSANTYDESRDYFPDKATPDFATGWTVQYFNNYKVVTITRSGEQYVLTQRGTPQPEFSFGQFGGVFVQIPVERTAVLSNGYFGYLELLGERRSMVVTTKHDYLNEPCLLQMAAEDGMLDGVTDRDLINNNVFAINNVDVIFRWSGSRDDELNPDNNGNPAIPPAVKVDTGAETTAAGIMEWLEYVSLFFNREQEATRMVFEMKARYDCIVTYVRPQPTVRVLYSSFSYSSSASEVRCSFYISSWHERMIIDAGGEVIGAYPGYSSSGPCNMTAFREHAESADVWLYKSNNFQAGRYGSSWAVMWNISSEVTNVAPYVSGRTFDPNGNHFRDFWASRMPQLDVELEDLVVMLHPSLNYAHTRTWWLDVRTQTDPGRPTASQCQCKYGAQQLLADACPGNPMTAPQGNLIPNSIYGCNGELASTVCDASTEEDNTSGSPKLQLPVSLPLLLVCLVFAAK